MYQLENARFMFENQRTNVWFPYRCQDAAKFDILQSPGEIERCCHLEKVLGLLTKLIPDHLSFQDNSFL